MAPRALIRAETKIDSGLQICPHPLGNTDVNLSGLSEAQVWIRYQSTR